MNINHHTNGHKPPPPPSSSNFTLSASTRTSGMGASVFSEFTQLAISTQSVNLGQGFPDFTVDPYITDILVDVAKNQQSNQYTRSIGHIPLCNAIATHYNKYNPVYPIDSMKNVLVTCGATEAMYTTLQALLNKGDEVIIFQPFYDAYVAQIEIAGGVVRYATLDNSRLDDPYIDTDSNKPYYSAQDYTFDINELKSLINNKTKAIIINTPHNPLGKIFTRAELQQISDLIQPYPHIVCISDDVYEHLIYDDSTPLVRMRDVCPERTVTFGSAGKTYSITGWKIGWIIGPEQLIHTISLIHQWVPFCVSTPLQQAVAEIITQSESNGFFDKLKNQMKSKHDRLFNGLLLANLSPIKSNAGYFIVVANTSNVYHNTQHDIAAYENSNGSDKSIQKPDFVFAKWLTRTIGLTPIPVSAFMNNKSWKECSSMSRFAFCKKDESIDEAIKRLGTLQTLEQ